MIMKNTEKMNQEILDELKEAQRIEEEKDGNRIMSFLGSPIFTIVCCN